MAYVDIDEDSGAWLRPSAAARLARVSIQRINDLVAQGRIRIVRTPLGRLMRREDVEAYSQQRDARARLLAGGTQNDDDGPLPAA